MTKTKYTGVFYRTTKEGDKVFYLRGKLNGKVYSKRIKPDQSGKVTAQYANQMRMKLHADPEQLIKKKDAPTLQEASNKYFNHIKHKSDTNIMKSRVTMYAGHLMPLKLDVIRRVDIEELKTDLLDTVSEKTERTLSPATVNRIIDIISAIYNSTNKLNETNYINPCKGVDRLRTDNARERFLTSEDIQLLLDIVRDHQKLRKKEQITLFINLAVTTGARLTSILNIQARDIKDGRITIKDFKSDSTYTAYLHPSVDVMLDSKLKPNDYVVGGGTKAVHRTSINKMLQPVLNETFNADLDIDDAKNRVVIHTFRHTFASLLAINGTPIFTIKKLLNHSNIDQTMRYAKLAPDQGMEAVLKLF